MNVKGSPIPGMSRAVKGLLWFTLLYPNGLESTNVTTVVWMKDNLPKRAARICKTLLKPPVLGKVGRHAGWCEGRLPIYSHMHLARTLKDTGADEKHGSDGSPEGELRNSYINYRPATTRNQYMYA